MDQFLRLWVVKRRCLSEQGTAFVCCVFVSAHIVMGNAEQVLELLGFSALSDVVRTEGSLADDHGLPSGENGIKLGLRVSPLAFKPKCPIVLSLSHFTAVEQSSRDVAFGH